MAHAQVHATLALVEQQRIANMQAERLVYAVGGTDQRSEKDQRKLNAETSARLDSMIREGLGL
ncbi:hypothetical protein MN032_11000 [Agromyces atrinae]|uniref:hypothetical protein n=1 Tax=Agromyces atrinae TaxID=592376 RepID=UPI001F58A803|nr:hypothetical protein [Agromyces atrinae]MCI2958225.1 hypothetical protein [Agromyces atrinae]